MTELSLVGNKGARQNHLPRPSPNQNPKGNQFLPGNLPAPPKHPKLCFCGATPLAAGLTPSHCHRAPPEVDPRRRSELSLPLLPLCTLLPTPANTPDPQHHKPGSVPVPQTGATPPHSESCPYDRGREGTHQSDCGPSGRLGADIRSDCGPAHQLQLYTTAKGKCPAGPHHSRDYPK